MYKLVCFFGNIAFRFKPKVPKDIKKILILRSGGIGDVLMSTPLVKAIRKNYPKAEIIYFVGNWSKEVLVDNPNIDKLFNYDDLIIINRDIIGILQLIRKIRKEKFDSCFNLEKSWHWGVLSYLFGIPTRIGFDRFGEGFANTLTIPFDGSKYELEYYLDLAKLMGIRIPSNYIDAYLAKKEIKTAKNFVKKNNLKNKIIIGIAPGGADNPAQQAFIKRWPIENYISLIDKLIGNNKKTSIILFGGKNDIETCKQIKFKARNKDRIINIAGKIKIKESAALMKHCRLLITHDSGPMHIAAAVNVPLLVLFGPTQPKRFAPKNAKVVKSGLNCSPCYNIYGRFKKCRKNKCMESIAVKDVLLKIDKKILNQDGKK